MKYLSLMVPLCSGQSQQIMVEVWDKTPNYVILFANIAIINLQYYCLIKDESALANALIVQLKICLLIVMVVLFLKIHILMNL